MAFRKLLGLVSVITVNTQTNQLLLTKIYNTLLIWCLETVPGPVRQNSRDTGRKITYLPLNCSGLDPSFSQQTPGLEGIHWEVLGWLLSRLEDLDPPGNDGMEDSPLSPGSALEASPPAAKPEFSLALVDCTHEGSTIKTTKRMNEDWFSTHHVSIKCV